MEKFINYKEKLDSLNILIKIVIKLNNEFYKLAIKILYSKLKSKYGLYIEYISYYNK